MAQFARIIAALWLLVQLAAAIPRLELQPLPWYLWDGTSAPKLGNSARAVSQAAAEEAIKPVEKAEFFWASTDSKLLPFIPSHFLC